VRRHLLRRRPESAPVPAHMCVCDHARVRGAKREKGQKEGRGEENQRERERERAKGSEGERSSERRLCIYANTTW